MTDRLEQRGRRAGAAVHERTARMDPDEGLDAVMRRARRPRASTVLVVVLALLLAVPAAGWLLTDETRIELEPPAATPPPEETPEPEESPSPTEEPVETEEPEEPEPEESPAPSGPASLGEFGTDDVTANDFPYGGGEIAFLTGVRVAGHDGFDRVVLEFDGPDVPSYRVAYQEPPIRQDGSGEEVAVAGTAFLEMRLTPASGVDLSGDDYTLTYEGPDRVTGDTAVVTEVVRTGDFEANLAWVIGLHGASPFSVTVLEEPLRLVVDIKTG